MGGITLMWRYIKSSPQIIISYLLVILCLYQVGNINNKIESKINPSLYVLHNDKYKKIWTYSTPPIDFKKIQSWSNSIIIECFSFTKDNYQSKSKYCANKYFSPVAKDLYLDSFVETIGSTLEAKTASHYVGMPTEPFVYRTRRSNIVKVVGYGVRSIVSARDIEPVNFFITLYLQFSPTANNQYSMDIVGLDFK